MDDAAAQALNSPYGPRYLALFNREVEVEGGFADSPGDHGGATKYGLSLRYLSQKGALSPQLMAEVDINHDGVVDLPDIEGMTIATARDVYYPGFYLPVAATLPQPIDAAVFDQTVNDGALPAVKLLQAALNELSPQNLQIAVDGAMGPQTRTRLDAIMAIVGAERVLDAYRAQAIGRYQLIVRKDPTQAKFLAGWVNRARELGDV